MSLSSIFNSIKLNWQSGLTVALVSLPLSIALSLASGAGPIPGVITGVWACLIASIFGGSQFNIVGTAGALTTILYAASVLQIGGIAGVLFLPLLAILTGLVILLVYVLKLERYLVYIPSSVMYGFASGVAILIAINQLNDALGLRLKSTPHFLENVEQTFSHISSASVISFVVFAIALTILLLFKKFVKNIPGVIPVSFLGIVLGYIAEKTQFLPQLAELTTLQEKLNVNIVPQLWQAFNVNTISALFNSLPDLEKIVELAFIVALISILETLITAKLADKITKQKSSPRQEVLALGLANLASGIMGGLPASGVFIRTGLNVKSGATGKVSGILAAIFTAILAVFLLPYFQYLPMPILAAILFNTAIGLLEIKHFVHYFYEDKKSLIVSLAVMLLTVIQDASIGILLGTTLALLFFVDKLSKGEFEVRFNRNRKIVDVKHGTSLKCVVDADVVVYSIEGIMVYLDAPAHIENLQKIAAMPKVHTVILRLRDLFYVDLDGMEMLEEAILTLQAEGKDVILTKPTEDILDEVLHNHVIADLNKRGKIVDKTADALTLLGFKKEDIGAREENAI